MTRTDSILYRGLKGLSTLALSALPALTLMSNTGFVFLLGLLASPLVFKQIEDYEILVAVYAGYLLAIAFFGIVFFL